MSLTEDLLKNAMSDISKIKPGNETIFLSFFFSLRIFLHVLFFCTTFYSLFSMKNDCESHIMMMTAEKSTNKETFNLYILLSLENEFQIESCET